VREVELSGIKRGAGQAGFAGGEGAALAVADDDRSVCGPD